MNIEGHESGVICIKKLNPNCRCPFCNKLREEAKDKDLTINLKENELQQNGIEQN